MYIYVTIGKVGFEPTTALATTFTVWRLKPLNHPPNLKKLITHNGNRTHVFAVKGQSDNHYTIRVKYINQTTEVRK